MKLCVKCAATRRICIMWGCTVRQYFFAEGRYLRYESNYQAVKDNENDALLQAGISRQILKAVDRSFRSFFNLLKKAQHGEYRFHDVRMPHYLKKDGYQLLLSASNRHGDHRVQPELEA